MWARLSREYLKMGDALLHETRTWRYYNGERLSVGSMCFSDQGDRQKASSCIVLRWCLNLPGVTRSCAREAQVSRKQLKPHPDSYTQIW